MKITLKVGLVISLSLVSALVYAGSAVKQNVKAASKNSFFGTVKQYWPDYSPLYNAYRKDIQEKHPLMMGLATSLTAPVGRGLNLGQAAANLFFVSNWPDGKKADANLSFALGLGDGDRLLGVQVGALIDSTGVRENFAKNGTFFLKLFRWLTPYTSVAVGSANLAGWGAFDHKAKGYYADFMHQFKWCKPMELNVGIGTGSFVDKAEFRANSNDKVDGFASIAVELSPRMNLITSYAAESLSFGTSFVPSTAFPFLVTMGAYNVVGSGNAYFGINLSVGYSGIMNHL